jgi:hypothetical protein
MSTPTDARCEYSDECTPVGESFLLGLNQEYFLTCEEFAISGNSEPPGCVKESD